jgi:hypothetical protein
MIIDTKKPAGIVIGPFAGDRRTDPRYKFTAMAEIVEDKSGKRIETRVDDLSQRGCYLSTDIPSPLNTSTKVRITKGTESFEANARVVSSFAGKGMGLLFTDVDPQQDRILTAWLMGSSDHSWLGSNRRRSPRVLVRLPVCVSGKNSLGAKFEEETYTETVSAHGALIPLSALVMNGQPIILSNSPPKGTVQCTVAHIGAPQGGFFPVGVTFVVCNQYQLFWQATFPSPAWTKGYLDTKLA